MQDVQGDNEISREDNYSVTSYMQASFCKELVREFYYNLTKEVKHPRFLKYEKVYVRGHIFQFSPAVINGFLRTSSADNVDLPSLDKMISVITGGQVTMFPAHPKKLSASKLTSMYSVLHNTAGKTWTPSRNSTVVTKHHDFVFYAIGTRSTFNYGRLVFDTVIAFADCAQPTLKLLTG
ncbi:uncharacterized protein [Henckelia pumila]|uniref:uncharacterized protein isoform X1 n=1 Tax=Henckelia pumila TaxID=405737 RepID=UPI003C6DCDE8